jgi:PAS domain S-box-containing protein
MNDERKTKSQLIEELQKTRTALGKAEEALQKDDADLTESRRLEMECREEEELYRTIVSHLNEGIVIAQNYQVLFFNQQCLNLLGYSDPREIIDRSVFSFIHPDDREMVKRYALNRQRGGSSPSTYEFKLVKKDGTTGHFRASVALITFKGEPASLVNLSDITERIQAEEALQVGENRYRSVFENTGTVMLIVNEDMTITLANQEFEKLTGFSRREIEGKKKWTEFVHPPDLERMIDQHKLRRSGQGKAINRYEFQLVRKDGALRDIMLTVDLIPGTKSSVASLLDITDRKQAEKAIRESEMRYRQLIDQAADGIFVVANNGAYQLVNKKFCEMLGYSEDELIKLNVLDTYPDELKVLGRQRIENVSAGEIMRFERPMKRKDGSVFDAEVNVAIINDSMHQGIVHDITERIQAERALRQSEEKYRNIFVNAAEGIFQTSPDGQLLSANPALAKMSGFSSPQEMIYFFKDLGRQLYVNPDDRRHMVRMLKQWGKLEGLEVEMYREDGSKFWISMNIHVVRDAEGNIRYFEGTNVDITARKEAEQQLRRNHEELSATYNQLVAYDEEIRRHCEELTKSQRALKESEEKYRILAENASDIIWSVDIDLKFTYVSPSAERLLGWTMEEWKSLRLEDVLAPDTLGKVNKAVEEEWALEGRPDVDPFRTRTMEIEHYRKDGSIVWFETTTSSLRDQQGRLIGFMGVSRNISERMHAQEALLRSETRFRTLFEKSPIGISIARDGITLYVNNAGLRISGCDDLSEIVGTPQLNRIAPESRAFVTDMMTRQRRGEAVPETFEITGLRRDGSTFPLFVQAIGIQLDDGPATVSFLQDMTERKKTEEERMRLEAQLSQAQKMEAIGTLAGGIAHDFNNILMAMIGYTELAKDEGLRENRDDCLDQVLKASARAKNLVHQILSFSRMREVEKKPVQIDPIIREVLKLLRASIPSTIEIRPEIESNPFIVSADPTQIHQILMNLCTNATHAMKEKGGVLKVGLSHEKIDRNRSFSAHRLEAGSYAKLTVADTGQGIDPAILDRIFEPFFTTKAHGEGTGLGMSVIYGIIKSCGGAIDVVSDPGQGTTISVYLPLIESIKKPGADIIAENHGGKERILFVDDETALVDLGERMLRSLGYQVTARTSSVEALELFRAKHGDFDLVFTDMTMPNMTGAELAQKMLAIRPDIPIILCTGYSEIITEENARDLGIRGYAMKPLSRNDIGKILRDILNPT